MYYSDMVNAVQPGISSTDFVVEGRIEDAVLQFCQETGIWVTNLTAINTVADEDTYSLTPPDGAVITAVLSIKDASGYEMGFTVEDDFSAIILDATPSSVFSIVPRVTLIPEVDAGEFPDFIYYRHKEALIAGARYKLFEMPNRTWSNDKEAAKYYAKFRSGITKANQSILMNRKRESFVRLIPFV